MQVARPLEKPLDEASIESSRNAALRHFEATEANLEKLERLWNELEKLIPGGISFESNPRYDYLRRAYADVLQALPKIDGWRPDTEPPDLNELAQNRFDAWECDEIYMKIAVEEKVQQPGREIAEYRYRLNRKRRQIIRDALFKIIHRIDECFHEASLKYSTDDSASRRIDAGLWNNLRLAFKEMDMLLGASFERPEGWAELPRHLHFGMISDLRDIVGMVWPQVKSGITKQLFDQDEPLPITVEDLGDLVAAAPSGPVATRLKWELLSPEQFERLIFGLIRSAKGYENPAWLMNTSAPDRGRDLSVLRVADDLLAGVSRSRVIIQCKHWLSKSVAGSDVSDLKDQMAHWEPPKVDVLVIATSGRFTADAVALIEKHNAGDRALRIEMWPESHLEHLLAVRPALIAEFGLR